MAERLSPTERTFQKDEVILQQEEASDGRFFYLKHGTALAEVHGRTLGEIHAGEFFGELAAILNQPRTASVVALTPCRVWEFRGLTDEHLHKLIAGNPKVRRKMLETIAERLRDMNNRYTRELAQVHAEADRLRRGLLGTIAALERIVSTFQSKAMAEVLEHLKATTGIPVGDDAMIDRSFFTVCARALEDRT